MKLYGAIDLHSTNRVMVLIDEEDKIVYEKRLPNDLVLILKELSVYQERVGGIVVESTYNWYWLVDGLMAEGYKVHLANTAAIQRIAFYPPKRGSNQVAESSRQERREG